jgi:flagellar basal body-associated protein FliL
MINEFPPDSDFPESPALKKKSLLARLFSTKTLIVTTAVLVVLHSLLLLFVGFERFVRWGPESMEVGLGTFRYDSPTTDPTGVSSVQFDLHVSLLEKCDRLARHLLRNHEHRVQQSIEELLREAADEDFRDPKFTDLKRQMQETINATLDERVIAEVIVTGVTVEREGRLAAPDAEDPAVIGRGGDAQTGWDEVQTCPLGAAFTDTNPSVDNLSLPSVD